MSVIGYTETPAGFKEIHEPVRGSIVTQAFIFCKNCHGVIYHCMGPNYDAICLKCYGDRNA